MGAIKSIRVKFDKYKATTDKAWLIEVRNQEIWLPKKLCRNFITNNKLGGNVSIPTFLYEKIFGETITDDSIVDADYVVTKHKPERKEPLKVVADASLTR